MLWLRLVILSSLGVNPWEINGLEVDAGITPGYGERVLQNPSSSWEGISKQAGRLADKIVLNLKIFKIIYQMKY